jgi:hypothetical protein
MVKAMIKVRSKILEDIQGFKGDLKCGSLSGWRFFITNAMRELRNSIFEVPQLVIYAAQRGLSGTQLLKAFYRY